jgi:hypothetical protein
MAVAEDSGLKTQSTAMIKQNYYFRSRPEKNRKPTSASTGYLYRFFIGPEFFVSNGKQHLHASQSVVNTKRLTTNNCNDMAAKQLLPKDVYKMKLDAAVNHLYKQHKQATSMAFIIFSFAT